MRWMMRWMMWWMTKMEKGGYSICYGIFVSWISVGFLCFLAWVYVVFVDGWSCKARLRDNRAEGRVMSWRILAMPIFL
jgi:hypothetical protein